MKNNRRKDNCKAFTIVELVVVIAVIAILASVMIPTFGNIVQTAKDSKAMQEARQAYIDYLVENNGEMVDKALYQAKDGRWVALENGTTVGVYDTSDAAAGALQLSMDKFVSSDGKLHTFDVTTSIPDDSEIEVDFPDSFEGLKVSILGDSISTFSGSGSKNNVYPGSTTVKEQSDTWWAQVIDLLGMELLVNNASGGSRILSDEYFQGGGIRDGNYAAYRDRCVNLHSGDVKPDVILVFLGTNDFSYHVTDGCAKCQGMLTCPECTSRTDKNVNVCDACRTASGVLSSFCNQPLGTADEVDPTTETPSSSCEAYAVMLSKMKAAYPDAYIYCMSLLPRVDPYQGSYHDHGQPTAFNAELKKVAEAAGAMFINLEDCVSNSSSSWSTYFGDAVHPTVVGMDTISAAVIDALLDKDATYTVAWNLANVTPDSYNSMITDGAFFSVTLNANAGYKISSVRVTMGGVDVTDSCYADRTVTIPAVDGNVVITVVAESDGIIWTVGAIHSADGTNVDGADWSKRIRSDFIDVSQGAKVSAFNEAEFCPVYYDGEFNFVSSPGVYQTSVLTLAPGQYAYMRLMVRNKNATEATLTADFSKNIVVAAVSEVDGTRWSVSGLDARDGSDTLSTGVTRITSGFIPVTTGMKIVANNGAEFIPLYYNADFSYISYGSWVTELEIPAGQYVYVRLVARNKANTGAALTAEYGDNISLSPGSNVVSWSLGTISCGSAGTGNDTDQSGRIRTGFIAINNGVAVATSNGARINVVFYDASFKIIPGENNHLGGFFEEWNSAGIPDNIAYIRIVARNVDNSVINPDFGANITLTLDTED